LKEIPKELQSGVNDIGSAMFSIDTVSL
jgi:hypothetical protein